MPNVKNLLQETKEEFESSGLVSDDIVYIGSLPIGEKPFYSCTWKEYEILADFEYNSGFGGQDIARDLVVIFNDGSVMDRREYDGSEWWELHRSYAIPKETKPITHLESITGSSWTTLAEIHEEEQIL